MSTDIKSQNMRLKDVLASYGVYIALFIGTGFLAGSIVHYPMDPTRYTIIGILGVIIFTTASTLNEAIYSKKNFRDEGVIKVIAFSLLLSIGIGMISGGAQHFDEFPVYGSYLIPFGIVISLIAYLFKSNIQLTQKQTSKLVIVTLLVIAPLGLALNTYAQNLTPNTHGHGAVGGKEETSMTHSVVIRSDQDFLHNMIPHHEEAVTSSQYVLSRTTDPELRQFTQVVIDGQSQEIAQMRQWHQDWLGSEYASNSNYVAMMGDMSQDSGTELDRAYIEGMIEHHQGAIQMAKDVLPITTRDEVKTMANSIVQVQEKEVEMLKGWLQTKYGVGASATEGDHHTDNSGH